MKNNAQFIDNLSSNNFTTTSVFEKDGDEIFEDASNDISILSLSAVNGVGCKDKSILVKATHQDFCVVQKVYEPLFLRKCLIRKAERVKAPPTISPILEPKIIKVHRKCSTQSALLTSLDEPTFCVRYLAANRGHRADHQLIFQTPMCFVRFLVRPQIQTTLQSKFEETSEEVNLLLSPDKAIIAQKMLPKWQTVTFTLAYGKHVAVKYRINEGRKNESIHVKAVKQQVKLVHSNTLNRNEPISKTEIMRCNKSFQLELSTVEKCDPQIVKRVFLEHHVQHIENSKAVCEEAFGKKDELNIIWQRNDSF